MMKVKIVFPSLLQLWDFKQVFREHVLQTICWRNSLICLCSESEIELAVNAYHAKVEKLNEESLKNNTTDKQQTHGFKSLQFITVFLLGG